MELFKAHNQWKTRPADERFTTVADMHAACVGYRQQAAVAEVPYSALRVEAVEGGDLAVVGKTGVPATLSNWSMGQLCQRAGAPAGYLRELPATLAAQNLNHGLKARGLENSEEVASLMFHKNGGLVLRSATSERYSRIWNSDITGRLVRLQQDNPSWKNPLAYKVTGASKDGGWPTFSSELVPSGLYASDHDMFAFLVDESKTLEGSPAGINRGFFIWNSEVGASSFGVMTFLYDRVCGNNIVWGAKNVAEIRVRHVGNADERAFRELQVEVKRYMDSSASETEAMIRRARTYQLGATKEEALDALMVALNRIKAPELSRKRVEEGLALAETRQDRYGDPRSLWGAVGGITEAAQVIPFMDQRAKVERAAGKLLQVAF